MPTDLLRGCLNHKITVESPPNDSGPNPENGLKMTSIQQRAELHRQIWQIANDVRGSCQRRMKSGSSATWVEENG